MERAQCGDAQCGFFPRLLGVILRALRHAGRDHHAPLVDVAIETCAEHHKNRHASQAGAVQTSSQALDARRAVGRRHTQQSGTMGGKPGSRAVWRRSHLGRKLGPHAIFFANNTKSVLVDLRVPPRVPRLGLYTFFGRCDWSSAPHKKTRIASCRGDQDASRSLSKPPQVLMSALHRWGVGQSWALRS